MNLEPYRYQIRRWIMFAILPAILVGLLEYARVAQQPKQYSATAILYVQHPVGSAADPSGNDVASVEAIMPTYAAMIESPVILGAAGQRMVKRFPGHGIGGVSVSSGNPAGTASTQLMDITVTASDPNLAAAGANVVARVFIDTITRIQKSRFAGNARSLQAQITQEQGDIQYLEQRIASYQGPATSLASLKASLKADQSILLTLVTSLQQYNLDKSTALQGVRIWSYAYPSNAPVGPFPLRSAIVYAFVGLLICASGIYLYDYVDDVLRTPEEVSQITEASIIGTVQRFDVRRLGMLVTVEEPRSPLSEAYRIIRTNIQFTNPQKRPRTILITSPQRGEGKSTTAANLSRVLAEGGQSVTLVDCDLRRPDLQNVFGLSQERPGLSMLLASRDLDGPLAEQTDLPNLSVLWSGPVPSNPADLLGSARMRELVARLHDRADIVLLDSPPVLPVTDASILATVADSVVLVVDPRMSKRREVKKAREMIDTVGGKVLGVVINRFSRPGGLSNYYHDTLYRYDETAPRGRVLPGLRRSRQNGSGSTPIRKG